MALMHSAACQWIQATPSRELVDLIVLYLMRYLSWSDSICCDRNPSSNAPARQPIRLSFFSACIQVSNLLGLSIFRLFICAPRCCHYCGWRRLDAVAAKAIPSGCCKRMAAASELQVQMETSAERCILQCSVRPPANASARSATTVNFSDAQRLLDAGRLTRCCHSVCSPSSVLLASPSTSLPLLLHAPPSIAIPVAESRLTSQAQERSPLSALSDVVSQRQQQ